MAQQQFNCNLSSSFPIHGLKSSSQVPRCLLVSSASLLPPFASAATRDFRLEHARNHPQAKVAPFVEFIRIFNDVRAAPTAPVPLHVKVREPQGQALPKPAGPRSVNQRLVRGPFLVRGTEGLLEVQGGIFLHFEGHRHTVHPGPGVATPRTPGSLQKQTTQSFPPVEPPQRMLEQLHLLEDVFRERAARGGLLCGHYYTLPGPQSALSGHHHHIGVGLAHSHELVREIGIFEAPRRRVLCGHELLVLL